MNRNVRFALMGLAVAGGVAGGEPSANYSESQVPPYTLPDPLVANDGTAVRDATAWRAKRRPELLEVFAREVYGRTPAGRPAAMRWRVTATDQAALGGRAVRKEVTIWFTAKTDGPQLRLLIHQPQATGAARGPWPVFLGWNFQGNHTVDPDPGITPTPATAAERARGAQASRWQIATVVGRGYATATAFYGDLTPDRATGLTEGVPTLFATGGAEERAPDAWGAIGAWAWGLSRALDYLESDRDYDAKRVAVHGHSRLGKTALWAGAQDERFALVISNDSGCGGAALSKRIFGETVGIINQSFPHWFVRNFRRYSDREADLPVDQHELLALIAPRPLYVASAAEDLWADPRGEFLALVGAEPVYRLLGKKGLGTDQMPAVDQPVHGDPLAYHIRTGAHDITAYDWARYLDFADRHLRAR